MKTVLITGANSGLGLELTRRVSQTGHRVLMACRDAARGEQAVDQIRRQHAEADVRLILLDLADPSSIRACADALQRDYAAIDVLVNNAAVMLPADPKLLVHGVEHHFGVNFLGHFAATAMVMDLLRQSSDPRIVHVTSMSARFVRMDLAGLGRVRGMRAYGLSKLANLMFALELDRRAGATPLRSVACQPGYVTTPLTQNLRLARIGNPLLGRSVQTGVQALLQATLDDELPSGAFVGPDWLGGMYGPVRRQPIYRSAIRSDDAAALWRFAEQHTGLTIDL